MNILGFEINLIPEKSRLRRCPLCASRNVVVLDTTGTGEFRGYCLGCGHEAHDYRVTVGWAIEQWNEEATQI